MKVEDTAAQIDIDFEKYGEAYCDDPLPIWGKAMELAGRGVDFVVEFKNKKWAIAKHQVYEQYILRRNGETG